MWRKSLARGVGHYRTDRWKDLSAAFTKKENTLSQGKSALLKEENAIVTTTEATTSSGGRDFGNSFGNTQANNSSHSWGERQEVMGTRFNERDWIFHLLSVSVAGGQGPGIPPATNLLRHDGLSWTLLFELNIEVRLKTVFLTAKFNHFSLYFLLILDEHVLRPRITIEEAGNENFAKFCVLNFYTQFEQLFSFQIFCWLWPMTYFSDCCCKNSLVFGKKL